MIRLTDDQRREIDEEGTPARVVDAQTSAEYVIIRAEVYDRLKTALDLSEPSREEQVAQLREFGKLAGWDNHAMNLYEDLRPPS